MKRDNEEFKKILSDKDEEMSHLKCHNQNLEDNIRNSKNDEEKPYRSNDDLEEEIKCMSKLIMDKDNELVQVQRKLESQELEIYQHQHMKELQ